MLADPKSKALTDNFAGQWLYLRRLEYQKPDRRAFPDFDERSAPGDADGDRDVL